MEFNQKLFQHSHTIFMRTENQPLDQSLFHENNLTEDTHQQWRHNRLKGKKTFQVPT